MPRLLNCDRRSKYFPIEVNILIINPYWRYVKMISISFTRQKLLQYYYPFTAVALIFLELQWWHCAHVEEEKVFLNIWFLKYIKSLAQVWLYTWWRKVVISEQRRRGDFYLSLAKTFIRIEQQACNTTQIDKNLISFRGLIIFLSFDVRKETR